VAARLVAIAHNQQLAGRFFDVAVRDVVMAVGAFALAKLTEVRETATVRESATAAGMTPARAGA
jgi:hypothetical protein